MISVSHIEQVPYGARDPITHGCYFIHMVDIVISSHCCKSVLPYSIFIVNFVVSITETDTEGPLACSH